MAEKDYKKLKKSVQRLSADLKSQGKDFKKASDLTQSKVDGLKKSVDGTKKSFTDANVVIETIIRQWTAYADSIIKMKSELESAKDVGNDKKVKNLEKEVPKLEQLAEQEASRMEAQFETIKKVVAAMAELNGKVSKI